MQNQGIIVFRGGSLMETEVGWYLAKGRTDLGSSQDSVGRVEGPSACKMPGQAGCSFAEKRGAVIRAGVLISLPS